MFQAGGYQIAVVMFEEKYTQMVRLYRRRSMTQDDKIPIAKELFSKLSEKEQITFCEYLKSLLTEQSQDPVVQDSGA